LTLVAPGSPISSTVIVIDIGRADYSFASVKIDWANLLKTQRCACCATVGRFARHGDYHKYHYQEQIRILRVRCRRCAVTHAVLPSFSLPGTSIGIQEAEAYLAAREAGASRSRAGEELLRRGLSKNYPKALEKMLAVAISRGKALFSETDQVAGGGLQWIESLCGPTHRRPLFAINRYGIEHRANPLCFSRASILLCGRVRVAGSVSHNQDSAADEATLIDSG
jgi:hypothetical protein